MSLTLREAADAVANLLETAGVVTPPSVAFDEWEGEYTSVSIHPVDADLKRLLAILPDHRREHVNNRDVGEFFAYTAIKYGLEIVIFQPVRVDGS